MAQHDYVIANDTAANVRADINDALSAIVSNNSGASAPATTYANQWWYDTTNDILKIRNEADTAWIDFATINQTDSQVEFSTLYASNFSDGSISIPAEAVTEGTSKSWVNFNGTGTITTRDSYNVTSLTDNGTGDYTVTLTNAMANTDYAALVTATGDSRVADDLTGRTASAIRVVSFNSATGGGVDALQFAVCVFGDLA